MAIFYGDPMKLLALVLAMLTSTVFAAAPPTPTGLTAVAGSSNNATVSWNSATGTASYNLLVGGTVLLNTTGLSANISSLTPFQSYAFGVQSVNVIGQTSAVSAYVTITAQGQNSGSGSSTVVTEDVTFVASTSTGSVVYTLTMAHPVREVINATFHWTTPSEGANFLEPIISDTTTALFIVSGNQRVIGKNSFGKVLYYDPGAFYHFNTTGNVHAFITYSY